MLKVGDLIINILGKFTDWITSLYIRPTIEVAQFDIEKNSRGVHTISFTALISNNSRKAFSVSEKILKFFKGKEEVAKIDVTRYEIVKKQDALSELNVLVPIDDIIMLQPGETKKIRIFGNEIEEDIDKAFFSCYTGRRTYRKRAKFVIKEVAEEQYVTEEKVDEERIEAKKNLKKGFEYLSEHIGAFTWISTVSVAIVAVFLKFLWYVYQKGKLTFWGIDISAISIINSGTLYNIVLLFVFSIFVIVLMMIPLAILRSKKSVGIKIVFFILLFIFFSTTLFIATGMYSFVIGKGIAGVIATLIFMVIINACSLIPSIIVYFSTLPRKKSKNRNDKKTIAGPLLSILGWFILVVAYTTLVGYDSARRQEDFRITSDGYAIIYETDDCYYLAEYDEKSKIVIKECQVVVKKENVMYYYDTK